MKDNTSNFNTNSERHVPKLLTQTELGHIFGMSSITIGKKLEDLGLKSKDSHQATLLAINLKLAKVLPFNKHELHTRMTLWAKAIIPYLKGLPNGLGELFQAREIFGMLKNISDLKLSEDPRKIKTFEQNMNAFYHRLDRLYKKLIRRPKVWEALEEILDKHRPERRMWEAFLEKRERTRREVASFANLPSKHLQTETC